MSKPEKKNVRKVDNYTMYRFGGRFDVIEEGDVTYIRDVLALVTELSNGMPHPVKTGLRWLRADGKDIEMYDHMLDQAWKKYLTLVENEAILGDFKKMRDEV